MSQKPACSVSVSVVGRCRGISKGAAAAAAAHVALGEGDFQGWIFLSFFIFFFFSFAAAAAAASSRLLGERGLWEQATAVSHKDYCHRV